MIYNWIQATADCGSDQELLIAKFRLKLKKVGNTTRPLSFFTFMQWKRKWLRFDRVPEELWTEIMTLYRRQ